MKTKPFEPTIEERDTLCITLENIIELNSNSNMKYDSTTHTYVWCTPEAEAEQKELLALHLKLKPKRVQKSGYILKEQLDCFVRPTNNVVFAEDIADFQLITWEEQE